MDNLFAMESFRLTFDDNTWHKKTKLSVVIPTLNEAEYISKTLTSLQKSPGNFEIIVVDGKSEDDTINIVKKFKKVKLLISSNRGRSPQMNEGAKIAHGEYLFFLHADTIPPLNFSALIIKALSSGEGLAGSFFVRFDNPNLPYRLLSTFTRFNLPFTTFGDQGLFLPKSIFTNIGGFASIPILEDVELQRRLRRKGRFSKILHPVETSARRFHRNGFIKQVLIDSVILLGYFAGIPPKILFGWYV